jgi:thioredoxin-related protein
LKISKTSDSIDFTIKVKNDSLFVNVGMNTPTKETAIKYNGAKVSKNYCTSSLGEIVNLLEIPDLLYFNDKPYTHDSIPGYTVNIQFLQKISSM